MRILVAGISYEDSFADNVAATFMSMGHCVKPLRITSYRRYNRSVSTVWHATKERIVGSSKGPDERKLLRLAKSFRPDLILALTREFSPTTLGLLKRKTGAVMAAWWGDPPANARRFAYMDPHWDLVFLKDEDAVRKTKLIRPDVFLLHEAMNPKWHRPISEQRNDSLVVAGNWYAFRQLLVERLLKDSVQVSMYGTLPPHWGLPIIKRRHLGRYIVREEKSRIFGEGLACLNSFTAAEGNSLNCRAFEIAGAGGLQLMENRPIVEECFEPGKEVLIFKTYEELLEQLCKARQYPQEMINIRHAAARRARAEHTYRHRLQSVLEHLQ